MPKSSPDQLSDYRGSSKASPRPNPILNELLSELEAKFHFETVGWINEKVRRRQALEWAKAA